MQTQPWPQGTTSNVRLATLGLVKLISALRTLALVDQTKVSIQVTWPQQEQGSTPKETLKKLEGVLLFWRKESLTRGIDNKMSRLTTCPQGTWTVSTCQPILSNSITALWSKIRETVCIHSPKKDLRWTPKISLDMFLDLQETQEQVRMWTKDHRLHLLGLEIETTEKSLNQHYNPKEI